MAQTGYTPISIYYSATATNTPTAGNLVAGELAINTADGKLFYKDSSGVVQTIASKNGVAGGSTTQVQYNSSGALAGSANLTFNGTTLTTANDASISGLTVGKGGGSLTNNTAVGANALSATNTGSGLNTAVGVSVLASNTSGQENSAFGVSSLGSNTTGSSNVGIGRSALASNTTASNNTAVGYQAGYNNTASGNTFLGYLAGNNITTGGYNIYIGPQAIASASGANQEIVLGTNYTSSIAGKGSNTGYIYPNGGGVYQGNNSSTWSTTSDQRLKKNIVDNAVGLDAITKIQVRNFEYRTADEVTDLPKEQAIDIKGVQLGAIAQELIQVLPDCVKTESTGVMSVDTSNITWHLINAVKELSAEVNALKAKLGA